MPKWRVSFRGITGNCLINDKDISGTGLLEDHCSGGTRIASIAQLFSIITSLVQITPETNQGFFMVFQSESKCEWLIVWR